ncbi:glycine--tRNA ligase subunit beta [Campylobacter sp. RM16192]|uniref:glycine--tRNA ligase subunit beta n=1 Tax=Campylobacter sp. RM16192 TaxID=1660080 RepID=UPI001451B744|nr:glycine--tRNA ligase subunit beta [Campylobacter sp. RM16192]QCD52768.1 glycyl-tRNA synthetase, beta chain [Campylobacter sp. RM16192]
MTKELIIEIGVEELPAIPFLKESGNVKEKWQDVLRENSLFSECEFYYTPRRIVFYHPDFKVKQDDGFSEFIGAPKQVAIKDGKFTQAAVSFANKCGITESELKFETINGKEVLYYKKPVAGRPSQELLGDMIEKFLLSLNFGKSMRWGDGKFDFIRPIRSFLVILGDEVVKFNKFDVDSGNSIYQHRSISYDKFSVKNAKDYFGSMSKIGVILDQEKRREKILKEFKDIEQKSGFDIEIDEDLLDEVVAITEYPTALMGEFEAEFLDVPSEAIITSMKENQRYFPVFKNKKLSNHFVVVSNAIADDYNLIIKGNEKVLRARLSDAMFFWQSDLKADFGPEKLKNITYLKELGSIYEKELRELKVVKALAKIYSNRLNSEVGARYEELLEIAVMLSKADLTTQMVYEFTELQGVMGYYYAKAKGESEFIANAIKEQYLPSGEKSECPNGIFSSVVALATKIDTLMGLFSVGKIPSGNKDPYALRRAANGIIKIILNEKLNFNLKEVLSSLANGYAKFDLKQLENFIFDRLYTFFDANASIIKACLASEKGDILAQCEAIKALYEISEKSDFRENFSTFKRLANIIKDENIGVVNESLFESEKERNLNSEFKKVVAKDSDFKERLDDLFALKSVIDSFFDKVMINVDDAKIRSNRIALIGQIYKEFLKIADIKEISL